MKQFKHDIIDIPKLALDESKNTHIYFTPDGKKLRSVTTMINQTKSKEDKKKLQDWKDKQGHDVANYIFSTASKIGLETHKLNENYINMKVKDTDYSLLAHAHHDNFIPYLNKISTVYGIESKLYSDSMKLAGTADCIGTYDGKLSIIDYKTKRSLQAMEWMTDYFIQVTAYSKMWEELTDQKIEQIVILASSEQNTMQEFVSEPELYYDLLAKRLEMFN